MNTVREPSITPTTASRKEKCAFAFCDGKEIHPGDRMDEYDNGDGVKRCYHPLCLDKVLLQKSYRRDYKRKIDVEQFPSSFTTIPKNG